MVAELLLPTKLYPPQPRPGFVARPQLVTQLNTGLDGKLTLLSAPAGFGKTTLLAEWVHDLRVQSSALRLLETEQNRQAPIVNCQFAWLSLDEHDNDLTRFLTYLIAALQNRLSLGSNPPNRHQLKRS
jgi:LuxR family maltose regulon positive regulatory protein